MSTTASSLTTIQPSRNDGTRAVGLARYKGIAILGSITFALAAVFGGVPAWVITRSVRRDYKHTINLMRAEVQSLKVAAAEEKNRAAHLEIRLQAQSREMENVHSEQQLILDRLRNVAKNIQTANQRSKSVLSFLGMVISLDYLCHRDEIATLRHVSGVSLAHISSIMEELQVRGILPPSKNDRGVQELRMLAMNLQTSATSDQVRACVIFLLTSTVDRSCAFFIGISEITHVCARDLGSLLAQVSGEIRPFQP